MADPEGSGTDAQSHDENDEANELDHGVEDPKERIRSKAIYLTYAGLRKGELSIPLIIKQLERAKPPNGNLEEFVVCEERHEAPADPDRDTHFHALGIYDKRFDIQTQAITYAIN